MQTYVTATNDYTTNDYQTIAEDVLQRFTPVGLEEMEDMALLRRIDTKYVLSETQLYRALSHLTADYRVLEVEGQRQQRYETLYFDTPDFALYRQHHDGWRSRYKVRSRVYADSGLTFLEVKHKTNQNITVKYRIQTPEIVTEIDDWAEEFLYTCFPYPARALAVKLQNTFWRITLVSTSGIERVTVDLGLRFAANKAHFPLPGIAIAEVKQAAFSLRSAFVGQMRALGVRPLRFSKYCIGVTQLYDQVKANRFKLQHLYLDKLSNHRDTEGTEKNSVFSVSPW
ncbi:MAG: polyphosphate polymerase domain-containing protein [Anaerolineae bacterium]